MTINQTRRRRRCLSRNETGPLHVLPCNDLTPYWGVNIVPGVFGEFPSTLTQKENPIVGVADKPRCRTAQKDANAIGSRSSLQPLATFKGPSPSFDRQPWLRHLAIEANLGRLLTLLSS
eukprot:843309-Amphidinium_carterae.1